MYPLAAFTSLAVCLLLRLYFIIPGSGRQRTRAQSSTASLAVFLGSGGHTSEALKLLTALDFSRYSPRIYILSSGDSLSYEKAAALESQKALGSSLENYTVLTIPRARRVHQTLLSTPSTALSSLLFCIYHVTLAPLISTPTSRGSFADVLLLNGPGSCVVLCAAVYVSRFLGLPSPKLIYVESFARVRSLSLSARLLRPFVDRFVVQWPELLEDNGRGEYRGWLV